MKFFLKAEDKVAWSGDTSTEWMEKFEAGRSVVEPLKWQVQTDWDWWDDPEKDMSKSTGLADDLPTSVERTGDDWLESIELVDDTTIFLQNAYEVKKLH